MSTQNCEVYECGLPATVETNGKKVCGDHRHWPKSPDWENQTKPPEKRKPLGERAPARASKTKSAE